jgi:hypothetical protein
VDLKVMAGNFGGVGIERERGSIFASTVELAGLAGSRLALICAVSNWPV